MLFSDDGNHDDSFLMAFDLQHAAPLRRESSSSLDELVYTEEEEMGWGGTASRASFAVDQTPDHAHAVLSFARVQEVSSSVREGDRRDRSRSRSPRERRIATTLSFDAVDERGLTSMRGAAAPWLLDERPRPHTS